MRSSEGSGRPEAERAKPRLGEDDGRLALVVDGVVQSVAVSGEAVGPGYWSAMLPDARPRDALLLGLGAGTFVHLLFRRFGELPVVGVERDAEVVSLARAHFGLDLPSLEVVVADAFEFVATCDRDFDLVCVDLYQGSEMVHGALAKPFLRRVRSLLRPGGTAVLNLMLSRRLPRQIHRVSEVFRIARSADDGFNVVLHCRA